MGGMKMEWVINESVTTDRINWRNKETTGAKRNDDDDDMQASVMQDVS